MAPPDANSMGEEIERTVQMDDGARIVLRRRGNPEGPRLLVSHGVGLAVDGFAMMWRHLETDHDLILFDMRGHGRNPPADPASVGVARIVADLRNILREVAGVWDDKPAWGFFHSYSGLAALCLASVEPHGFAGLVLSEPPVTRPPGHPSFEAFDKGRLALAERSVRRQAIFASVDELAAKYAGRSQYARFADGAAEELALALLVPDGDGWRLACAPEFESRFYATNEDDGLWERLGDIACPVLLLAGGDDLANGVPPALTACDLAHAGGFDLAEVARTTHMMVLERPHFIAELTRAFVCAAA